MRKPRKKVSDEEMRAALTDSNNTNVIRTVLLKYTGTMHADELESAGLHALWRTLQYHRPEFGQKFTTSLYRFTEWECRRKLRRQKVERKHMLPLATQGDICQESNFGEVESRSDWTHLHECMKYLSREQVTMLNSYYLDNRTMQEISVIHGCSKETVRAKLHYTVGRLAELCEEPELVYSE